MRAPAVKGSLGYSTLGSLHVGATLSGRGAACGGSDGAEQ